MKDGRRHNLNGKKSKSRSRRKPKKRSKKSRKKRSKSRSRRKPKKRSKSRSRTRKHTARKVNSNFTPKERYDGYKRMFVEILRDEYKPYHDAIVRSVVQSIGKRIDTPGVLPMERVMREQGLSGASDPPDLIQSIRNRVFMTDGEYIIGAHPKHVVTAFAMWD